MAYFSDGHYERVDYYSNPNVNYPGTGTATGFAGLGDESGVCNDGSSPVVTTTTTTTTTTTAASSSGGCKGTNGLACNFPFTYSGNTYNSCMEYYGNDWCRTDSGWSICDSSCNNAATSCQTTGGESCNFPFTYSGNTYNSCMEYYGNDWCRTDSGWGICSDSCY